MKILFLFIVLFLPLFSMNTQDANHRTIILEKVIGDISITKELKVWTDNQDLHNELLQHSELAVVSNCEEATVLILENSENLKNGCLNKHIFVLNYSLLSQIEYSFGAFFWKKGRPNIVIIEPRIRMQSIGITKDLEPYLEERVW